MHTMRNTHRVDLPEGNQMSPELRNELDPGPGTPPYDPNAARPGPDMTAGQVDRHKRRPWTPCRTHLFDMWAAVAPHVRDRCYWNIPALLWDAMKRDPDLNGDWYEPSGFGHHSRVLLGLPVNLVEGGLMVPEFVVPGECQPSRSV